MSGPLGSYVDAFVDAVGAELAELANGEDHRPACIVEAADLVSAILASDGRLTTSELEAWLDDIGPRLTPPVIVTSRQLRDSELITSKRRWLSAPSTLFGLLVDADGRQVPATEHSGQPARIGVVYSGHPNPPSVPGVDSSNPLS